ncbi:hypothetical protein BGX28_003177 [Mortierella sp. GBA30]|nr:hypothetical protein BGX28_003177 [Mortierella sp. GBA30]
MSTQPPSTSSSRSSSSRSITTPVPLQLQELLERILSSLNEPTLRFTAALVCRQWYDIVRPLRYRVMTWVLDRPSEENPREEALRNLEVTEILIIKDPAPNAFWYRHPPARFKPSTWKAFISRLNALADSEQRLKIKDLSILYHIQLDTELYSLLEIVGPTLTSLTLEGLKHPEVPLYGLLDRCPRLVHLRVCYKPGSCFRCEDPILERATPRPARGTLRSLTLGTMAIEEVALLTLLASCPNLERLRLLCLQGAATITRLDTTVATISEERLVSYSKRSFLEQVADLCPKLNSLHLSKNAPYQWRVTRLSNSQLAMILELFPKLRELSIPGCDFTTATFKTLTTMKTGDIFRNALTTLEIVGHGHLKGLENSLHEFLCEAPHLLRLKAEDICFPSAWFDLEGILDRNEKLSQTMDDLWGFPHPVTEDSDRLDYQLMESMNRKIWACRRLQTLHLEFDQRGYGCPCSAETSRVIFGYLSKVCPRLDDVRIRRNSLNLTLEGGLCLLTRLERLRRLVIVTDEECPMAQHDVEWICKSISPELRAKMVKMVAQYAASESKSLRVRTPFVTNTSWAHTWQQRLRNPSAPYLSYSSQSSGSSSISSTSSSRGTYSNASGGGGGLHGGEGANRSEYTIDGVDMRYLGRGRDILELLTAPSSSASCWRDLEYLEIKFLRNCYLGGDKLPLADWIKEYRPEIEFR